jgi:hypothetical protein
MFIHELFEEKQKGLDGKACWDGYKRMGTKMKGDKRVDNCVKMEEDHHDSREAVVNSITRRIIVQHTDLLAKHGLDAVGDAIDSVADWVGDVDEIGSSDVSAWVNDVKRQLEGA